MVPLQKDENVTLDQTDEQILDILKENARITYQELGNRLGMSRTVPKRPLSARFTTHRRRITSI